MSGSREWILSEKKGGATFGVHGYDAVKVRDMHGIFYASGPHIREGSKVPAFENIHIYPLIAGIFRLQLPPIDGKTEVLQKIRK